MIAVVRDQVFLSCGITVARRLGFGRALFMRRRQRAEGFGPILPVDGAKLVDHRRDFVAHGIEKRVAIVLGALVQFFFHLVHGTGGERVV